MPSVIASIENSLSEVVNAIFIDSVPQNDSIYPGLVVGIAQGGWVSAGNSYGYEPVPALGICINYGSNPIVQTAGIYLLPSNQFQTNDVGKQLWLAPTGGYTVTRPYNANIYQVIGYIVAQNKILIKPQDPLSKNYTVLQVASGQSVSQYEPVSIMESGYIKRADPTDGLPMGEVIGIAMEYGSANNYVIVQTSGQIYMDNSMFSSYDYGKPVYLTGSNYYLSTSAPVIGFVQRIGRVLNYSSFILNPQPAITQ
jgi:hypothetical protein